MESSNHSSVYQIGGVPVEFPHKPYGSQLAFMGRVISTLDRAHRQGHCHALLESPTGTGKTLSLLCSALAWQRNYATRSNQRPPPGPTPDPFLHGGGFVPEPEPSRNPEQLQNAASSRAQRKQIRPTIYYASRTHSQISQVIREFRKTYYRVPMAILASRKHYCSNKYVCATENIDEECKRLLKDEGMGCPEFKNAHKVNKHPSLQKGGCREVHDIEDLVRVGRTVKGCSYFAAQTMAAEADIVFCPYSYVINPVIRRAMDIDIKGAILILDEAHNIEDMARDAGSLDVEEEVLFALQTELGQLCLVDSVAMTYQPLYDMIQGIITWIGQRKDGLEKREFEHYCTCWTGEKALRELQESGISQHSFPVLKECATKAVKAASDAELDGVHLSGISALTLEGLFSSLCFLFSANGNHALDYQLALQRYVKRDSKDAGSGWTHSLSLWCLNPAVVFRDIADLSLSVILSSGTLSPMSSFASELGVHFEACMEAPHVIDVESQLWAAIISKGPGNCQLNASFKTSDGYAFQDSLGESLEEICKVVPGGVLVFFPSYKLLEKLRNRWSQTGQWSRLGVQKSLFVEPRSKVDDFETILKDYYSSVRGNKKNSSEKIKKGLKRHAKNPFVESPSCSVEGGAAFLAVCRGKVSEGIDFSDENARAVVIVGIPFPNKNDIQVTLKKKYNDMHKSSKNLLSGSEWYCHQAFRALNQAAGRCIRHRFDYGAIILIDERFKEERNLAYISRWIRKSIKHYDTFDKSLEELRTFFVGKDRSRNDIDVARTKSQAPDSNKENVHFSRQNILKRCSMDQKVQKTKLHSRGERKTNSDNLKKCANDGQMTTNLTSDDDEPFRSLHAQSKSEAYVGRIRNSFGSVECTDWELSSKHFRKSSRSSETSLTSNTSSDHCILMEETALRDCFGNVLKSTDADSHSTAVQASGQITGEPSLQAVSMTNSTETINEGACTLLFTTPERKVQADACTSEYEASLSVNSHHQKRKKMTDLDTNCCAQMCRKDSPVAESRCHADVTRSTSAPRDTSQRIAFSFDASTEIKHQETLSNAVTEKMYICCMICRNPLGFRENQFLVSGSSALSSKVYLAYVLENGPTRICTPESLSCTKRVNIPVVICAVESVGQSLLKNHIVEGVPQRDLWSEPDGCVFRIICCPFCTVRDTCLGLQTIATDALNTQFLNKVFFYADHLYIRNEGETNKKVTLPNSSLGIRHSPKPIPIESFAYVPKPRNSGGFSASKSKLKLPKRDSLPSTPTPGGLNDINN